MISPLMPYGRSVATRTIPPPVTGRCRLVPLALLALTAVLWGIVPAPCRCETDIPTEYRVKAAFLGKFLKYIDWQADAREKNDAELVIGIMGDSPMMEAAAVLAGKQVNYSTVRVRMVTRLEEIHGCRVIFVGGSEKRRLDKILDVARSNHVLTVSDINRFVQKGGGIGFVSRGNTIRFEVNNRVARSAGATLSSHLLRLAESVVE